MILQTCTVFTGTSTATYGLPQAFIFAWAKSSTNTRTITTKSCHFWGCWWPGGEWLLAARCPLCLPLGMAAGTLVRVSASSIRGTGTPLSTAVPLSFSWATQTCLQFGESGRWLKGVLLAIPHLLLSSAHSFPFLQRILPQSYHIPSIPLIALRSCLWNAEPTLLHPTGFQIPLLRLMAWGSWPLQWQGWGTHGLPLIVFSHSSEKYINALYPPLLCTAPHKTTFFLMLSVYHNSVSISCPPFIPHWSTLILSFKPDLTSVSLVFIWKKGFGF